MPIPLPPTPRLASLGQTVLNLATLRRKRDEALANLAEPLRLKLVAPVGRNPGELRMLTYVPPGLPPGAPLVVVLHGCTQNAAAYDHGSGWSTLAERHGFALLFPEQQRSNNPQLCFNWFNPDDVTQGRGEVESIREMTVQMLDEHRLDPRRVFITGLSAGAAMAASALATAPGLFAGSALIAGLPYGAATSVHEALQAMRTPPTRTAGDWGDRVRAAAPHHHGPIPSVQIWHGQNDDVVAHANADALVSQWTNVLGLPTQPTRTETVDEARRDTWIAPDGRPMLERWSVPGLGHGTPILGTGPDADRAVGIAGPHMLAAPVASTWHIARSWGLLTQPARPSVRTAQPSPPAPLGSVVEKALRAAGLLR